MEVCCRFARRPWSGAARLLFAATLIAGGAAFAQDETFVVRADARVEGVGLAAREAALKAAQRVVLERVLRSMVVAADLRTFKPILDNASRYVAGYDLLRHDVVDTWTSVEIDAEVVEKPLRSDIAALALPLFPEPPSVLLLLGEQVGDDRIVSVPDAGYAETALKDRLKRLGLNVAGSESLAPLYTQAQLIGYVEGGREEQSQFAERCLEDVVVVGTAVTSHAPESGGEVFRNRATLTLQVYRGGDAKLLDAFAISAAVLGADPNEAGLQAVEDACAKMAGEVAVAAALALLGSEPVTATTITIHAPATPERLEQIAAELLALPGVDTIRSLFISPALGRLRLVGEVPLVDLSRGMETLVVEGQSLKVNQAFGRTIEATAAPAPTPGEPGH